ncbi:MAG: hypothetical protein IT190_09895 [Microbacteriaceae bacterium]|nr:hypothetical protein [Microbacteriaceae bacterium]
MANTTFRDQDFKIDNAAASLTSIKAYLNQVDLQRTLDTIEDTAMSDTNRSYLHGLAGTTFSINGMVNSTTDGIFGPLVAAATSVTKTVEWKAFANRFYNGEVLLTNVQYSGSTNSLQTFSASMTVDGAINRTSVAL